MRCDDPVLVDGLHKRFGSTRALAGLSLRVTAGEVHGFLGPNGAGKSTTIRALLGLLRVDAGRVRVLGLDPWRQAREAHRRLAYVPGDVALWPQLTGGETVDLLLRARGLDPATTRRDELLERFALDPTRRARGYSKGNRQKVALVAALAAPVDLLVLDEPTSGLDPLMEQVFTECVREHAAAGATVLLSSHILAEVEHLADRVTIVRAGRVASTGRVADLQRARRTRVRAEVVTEPGAWGVLEALGGLVGVHDLRVDGVAGAAWQGASRPRVVTCAVDGEGLSGLLGALARLDVRGLTCAPPTLEELFLDSYRSVG